MAHPTMSMLGLGRMGSALARCFSAAGVPLTVWNRNPARCYAFDGQAAIALDAAAACAASEVIAVCLASYGAGLEVMDAAAGRTALEGKLLVQFGSGSASDARTLQAWSRLHGLAYLDAAVLAYPGGVGSAAAVVLYAGDAAAWERHRDTLGVVGGTCRYLGEAAGAAAALECAARAAYYGATLAMLHGAALCEAENLPLTEYFFIVKKLAPLLAATADQARETIAREVYAGADCSLETHAAMLRHVQRMSHDHELDPRLPDTLVAACRKALAAGHGEDEIAAVFETLRRAR